METETPAAPASALEVRDQLTEALGTQPPGAWRDHDLEREKLPGWVRPSELVPDRLSDSGGRSRQ